MTTIAEKWIQEGIEKGKLEGIEKGKLEGIEKGKLEGIEKGKLEVAKKMLQMGLNIDQIIEITCLRRDKIEKLMDPKK